MCALTNVKEVELIGMPKLKKCVLMGAFKKVKKVKMENAGRLEGVKALKEAMEKEKEEEERKRKEEEERKKKEEEERKRKEEEERLRREEEERKKKEEEEERKRKEEEERKRKRRGRRKKREEEEKRKKEEEEEKRKKEEEERLRREEEEEEERKRKEEGERKRREKEEKRKKQEEERRRKQELVQRRESDAWTRKTVTVQSLNELTTMDCCVGGIVIASKCCNEDELKVLDLSRFVNLRELTVGDECFENVMEVKLIGVHMLEKVQIGEKSFRKTYYNDPNRHFYLRDCGKLKELKIGCDSFSDYSVCEIENVPSLEVIEMGELNKESSNFYWASLELNGDCDEMK